MRSKIISLGVILCMLCVSCLKDEDTTVVLPNPFIAIPNSVVPTAIVDSLRNYMDIHEGAEPPCIEGEYVANPIQLVYASDDYYNDNFYDVYFTCASQDCRGWISYIEQQNSALLGTDSALVFGTNEDFTMVTIAAMEDAVHGWNCKLAILTSGTVAQGGINNFQYATVMLDKNDPHDVLLDIYDFRVYSDGDSFAKDTVWSNGRIPQTLSGVDVTCSKLMKKGGSI